MAYRRDPHPAPTTLTTPVTPPPTSPYRTSRKSLVEALESSTALINRLKTRNEVHEADARIYRERLARAEDEVRAAKLALLSESASARQKFKWVVLGMFVTHLVYFLWGWFTAPEMAYIRRRRAAVLS